MLVGGLEGSAYENSMLVVVRSGLPMPWDSLVEKKWTKVDLEGVECWISVGTLDIDARGDSELEASYICKRG